MENIFGIARDTCRRLRKEQTYAEKIFWAEVRNRKFLGKKFLRQYSVYFQEGSSRKFLIIDFYCAEKKLAIEIDGGIHEYQKEPDKYRSEILEKRGLKIFRFQNEEIEKDLSGVLERLKEFLQDI